MCVVQYVVRISKIMQLILYSSQQLINLLASHLKSGFSGVLAIETKVNSWQKQRTGKFVIYNSTLVYGGSTIPTNQQFAKIVGDKLQINSMNAALAVASKKLTNPESVRELIEILVKLKLFTWEDIEVYSHDQIVSMLEQFDAYPGQAKWDNSTDFDLCFGEDRHGLSWTKLKQHFSHRQQQWKSLAPTIPSMDAVPYVSESSLSKVSDPMVQEHLKTYVDGRRTLVDIATAMKKDPLKVANSYLKWANSGAVSFNNLSNTKITQKANKQVETIVNERSNAYLPIILSVDDSPIVQVSIKRALSGRYNVMFASTAAEALKMINLNSVDLLLLDLTMPDVDGLDFCRIVRKIPKFQDLPIVMVTARDGFFDQIKGQMAGTNGYITKPFKPEELIAVINKYVKVGQA